MSAEKITYEDQNQIVLETPMLSKVRFNGRVNINHLIARARKVKEKETITNLIFVGLTLSLIFIIGIILSF